MSSGPVYRATFGEGLGRMLGPLIGIVALLVIMAFVAVGLLATRVSVEIASQEVERAMTANARAKSSSSSSSSHSSSLPVRSRLPDYSEVSMKLKAKPKSRRKLYIGARSPYYLDVGLGEIGIIYADVRGIREEDYYIKWFLKSELVGMVGWIQDGHDSITVACNTKIPLEDIDGVDGKNAFRAELYSLPEEEMLCMAWMDVRCK